MTRWLSPERIMAILTGNKHAMEVLCSPKWTIQMAMAHNTHGSQKPAKIQLTTSLTL